MAFREKLVADIRTYFKQCKWEEILHDQIVEMLEMKPVSPYNYIQKKISLRSKLDNTKHSTFITQVLIYCVFVNPLSVSRKQIEDKILFLCVEKYQQTKIKRYDVINSANALFLLFQTQEKQKQYFMKMVAQEIEIEHVNVCLFAKILYSTVVYLAMKHEIDTLDNKLSEINLHIDMQILHEYLSNVSENVSIMKKNKVAIDSDSDLYKIIAQVALEDKQA